jgi:hypothetical protein
MKGEEILDQKIKRISRLKYKIKQIYSELEVLRGEMLEILGHLELDEYENEKFRVQCFQYDLIKVEDRNWLRSYLDEKKLEQYIVQPKERVDEGKIAKDIKEGILEIEGVEYEGKKSLSVWYKGNDPVYKEKKILAATKKFS